MDFSDNFRFLGEFLRSPTTIGAIAPSSRWLAHEICRQAGVANADVAVEFGPGTGAFTKVILENIKPDSHSVFLEHSDFLCQGLRQRFPSAHIINDSVENINGILAEHKIGPVDSIVSGLPWASFSDELQDSLLDATVKALSKDGKFSTFAYLQGLMLPAGWRFRKKISRIFSKVTTSPVIWRNLPPAIVYTCTK